MLKTAYEILMDAGIEVSDENYDACMSVGYRWDAEVTVDEAKEEVMSQYPEVSFDEPVEEVEKSTGETEEETE